MITITIFAVIFLAIVLVGGLVLMRLATSREHREGRLPAKAPTRLTNAARRLTGLYVEIPERSVRADRVRTVADADRGRRNPTAPIKDIHHFGNTK